MFGIGSGMVIVKGERKAQCFTIIKEVAQSNLEYSFVLKETRLSTNMILKSGKYDFNYDKICSLKKKTKEFCITTGANCLYRRGKTPMAISRLIFRLN